jgi:hypothetical protein
MICALHQILLCMGMYEQGVVYGTYKVLVGKPEGERTRGRPQHI